MKKVLVTLIVAAFLMGSIVIVQAGDPNSEPCKALKGKLDTALKAFDTAKAAFDKACKASDKIPGCSKLKTTMEAAQKAKDDLEKQYKDQCTAEEPAK